MLILTRKPGESLFIGESVKITIMEIKGNQIRIGIDAPKELRIYREEIYLQIMEENKMASDVSAATSFGPIAFSGGEGDEGDEKGQRDFFGSGNISNKPTLGKLIARPVSGLNSMKGKPAESIKKQEFTSTTLKPENLKQPEVIIRKKKKAFEEE